MRLLYTLFASLPILSVAGPDPNVHSLTADDTDPRQYGFLTPVLSGAEVVSLAESIHMTHEFPLIRIGMVRYMNENLGYHLLALEGSPEDLWVTQDQFLGSPDAGISQAMAGVFGLWNTPEMKQLFRYEADDARHAGYAVRSRAEGRGGRWEADALGAHLAPVL